MASKCELLPLPRGKRLLVRKPTKEPTVDADRNSGKYERLLGDEPIQIFVPFLLRGWALDMAHKKSSHLGVNATLASLERYYFWSGVSAHAQHFVKHCIPCQASKISKRRPQCPLISTPPAFPPWGDGGLRYSRSPLNEDTDTSSSLWIFSAGTQSHMH